jgi:hypothetical protein
MRQRRAAKARRLDAESHSVAVIPMPLAAHRGCCERRL